MILFVPGKEKYNYYELKYGPVLLEKRERVYLDYLNIRKNKLVEIYNSVPNKYLIKKLKLKQEIKFIKKI